MGHTLFPRDLQIEWACSNGECSQGSALRQAVTLHPLKPAGERLPVRICRSVAEV